MLAEVVLKRCSSGSSHVLARDGADQCFSFVVEHHSSIVCDIARAQVLVVRDVRVNGEQEFGSSHVDRQCTTVDSCNPVPRGADTSKAVRSELGQCEG